jgi:hypothetical protein
VGNKIFIRFQVLVAGIKAVRVKRKKEYVCDMRGGGEGADKFLKTFLRLLQPKEVDH